MTANGERFNPSAMTAAHKTLPLGSRVRVTNPNTGASVTVRINDRGPYAGGRCLDLSAAAFATIGNTSAGVMRVRYEVLAR
ncbi:septal ring lytic transglycosylase RlpA family protein [Nonomuraea turkmeniaca]|uniref:Septal ring lytic transglycosylase RlpA family protein n=2 Tax=Nonomuraea turkmeniaca TaxID=103838 RepID=A0A5S4EU68_9ACTN|nr:septal ring lytic transglycosylase RlpA family protein [Nonomuraea turkmeniaca]